MFNLVRSLLVLGLFASLALGCREQPAAPGAGEEGRDAAAVDAGMRDAGMAEDAGAQDAGEQDAGTAADAGQEETAE